MEGPDNSGGRQDRRTRNLDPVGGTEGDFEDRLGQGLDYWHQRYELSRWYRGYQALLAELPSKAKQFGFLELDDLLAIAKWGGNQHGVSARLMAKNSESDVRDKTAEAIRYFHKPKFAIGALLDLDGWGLTYASKTLMFMNPDQYGALDSNMRRGLKAVIGRMWDGDRGSLIRGYLRFLDWCEMLRNATPRPGPGPGGTWRMADAQSAVFQFCDEGGSVVT